MVADIMIVAGVSENTSPLAFIDQQAALTRMVNAFPNVDLIHNRLAIVVSCHSIMSFTPIS